MSRKILYGYHIQNGELTVYPQEGEWVKRIFSLYLAGMTQQQIADDLNDKGICYSLDHPGWTHNQIAKMIGDLRYTGKGRYPILIDKEILHNAQTMKTKRARKRGDHPALRLVKKLRCDNCGHSLHRVSEQRWKDTLHFLCDGCGAKATISDAALLAEIERQAAEYKPLADSAPYIPSEETIRLTNAINRGLEHPECLEEVMALILRGISARYASFPTEMTSADLLRLIREKDFDQAIRYITITADNTVTVTFR